jgi:DNA repair exonuclease SbcCD ATPase subunit
MLRNIGLHNFMSFEHEKLTGLDRFSTINVSGDNGHGKSAFLEAILYALYGVGRADTNSELVRGEETEMHVALTLLDRAGQEVSIRRGISGGKGWAQYFVGEELKAQGRAVEVLVSRELMGADSVSFLLTNFFGLGANDSLMKVRASERLETMQTIANLDVYSSDFHPSAVKRVHQISQDLTEAKGAMAVLEGSMESLATVKKEIEVVQAELSSKRAEVQKLQNKESEIAAKLDQMAAFNTEKATLKTKIGLLSSQEEDRSSHVEKLKSQLSSSKNDSAAIAKRLLECEAELRGLPPESELEEELQKAGDQVASFYSAISLRETALKDPHDANCPLCGGALEDVEDVKSKWSSEIEKFRTKGEKAEAKRSSLRSKLKDLKLLRETVARLKADQKDASKEQSDLVSPLEKAVADWKRVSSDLQRSRQRLQVVNSKIKMLESAFPEVEGLSQDISEGLNEVGRLEGLLESLEKDRLPKAEKNVKTLFSKRKEIQGLDQDRKAAELVAKAFSRYGIPLDLLQGLCSSIESEASEVYNAFDAGQIEVSSVEDRGRPGIEFFLVNRTGRRSWKQLSEGQKVMVFLSVRLALSKIISRSKGIQHDFLVLDEITGHLSPQKRDDLMQLIVDVLGKSFSQVFMVSHAEIRDIFEANVSVEMVDASSHLTLL